MKAIHEFIIELPEVLSETFTTEKGNTFYADKRFSVDRLSNRIAKVIEAPNYGNHEIQKGDEVMIEPTFMYKQIFHGVEQDYTNWVDREKGWFRVIPNMIILYRKDKNSNWRGHGENCMLKPIKVNTPKVTSSVLIIPDNATQVDTYEKEIAELAYSNTYLESIEAFSGDTVIINPQGGVKFWIDGAEYWWIRNKDVWGKYVKEVV